MGQALADPFQRNAAVGPAIAVKSALLDGKPLLGAAGISHDLLDRRVEHLAQRRAVDVVARSLAGRTQDKLFAVHHLVPGLRTVIAVAVANSVIGCDDADPGIIAEVELDPFGLDDGLRDHARIEDHHHRAILRRGEIEVANRGQAAGARHVLHDDGRISGNVIADVARNIARVTVVAAGRREADDDTEHLALVEVVGARARNCRRQCDQCRRHDKLHGS